jgi:putative cell wall-binding protein
MWKYIKSFLLSVFFVLLFATSVFASSPVRLSGQTRYDTAAAIAQNGWTQSDNAVLAYGENYPDALAAAPLAKKYDAPILLTNGSNLPYVTKQTLLSLKVKNIFIVGGTGVIPSSIDAELQSMNINVTRVFGIDKYETAIKIAQSVSAAPSEIFVVTGEDYADALSVASVAAIKQEPIILTPREYLPDTLKSYLGQNNIGKTYVIGDTDIISDEVVNQLPNIERIKGVDKYVRNINVASKFDNTKIFTPNDICVATGEGFADALTGSAYAAKKGIPIVLINSYPPSFTRLYTVIKLNMQGAAKGTPYIFGGTGVVKDDAVNYLYSLPNDSNTTSNNSSEVRFFQLLSDVPMPTNADYDSVNKTNDGFVGYTYPASSLPSDFYNDYGNSLAKYGWLYDRTTSNAAGDRFVFFTKDGNVLEIGITKYYTVIYGKIH